MEFLCLNYLTINKKNFGEHKNKNKRRKKRLPMVYNLTPVKNIFNCTDIHTEEISYKKYNDVRILHKTVIFHI